MTQRLVGRSTALVVAVLLLASTVVLLLTDRGPDRSGIQEAVLTKAEPRATTAPATTGSGAKDEPDDDSRAPQRETERPRADRTGTARVEERPGSPEPTSPTTGATPVRPSPTPTPARPSPTPTPSAGNPLGALLDALLGRR